MSAQPEERFDRDREQALRRAARALLRRPLLRNEGDTAEDYRLVRQNARELREWFDRNTGWALLVDAESARLRKIPGDTADPTHPAREVKGNQTPFTRRRYVLLCLALAVLERSETQIALGRLAEQVVLEAADPAVAEHGIAFTLEDRGERTDLVAVVRLLMRLGVLTRVVGDEDAYLRANGDVLYDVQRRVLAWLPAGHVGPSMIDADSTEERVSRLATDPFLHGMDSDDLRNRALRHTLTRRLLDDPVVYYDSLTEAEMAYLTGQRGAITGRITRMVGLVPEVRAEGIAMVDPRDDLTDVRMPEQGTHGHITLLLAEHLASASAQRVPVARLEERVRELAGEYGTYWSKSAREPGTERDHVTRALDKLTALALVRVETDPTTGQRIAVALPALARYAVQEPTFRGRDRPPDAGADPHSQETHR